MVIEPKEKKDPRDILPLDRYYAKYPNLYLWFSEGSDLQVFWERPYGQLDKGDEVNEVEEITIIRKVVRKEKKNEQGDKQEYGF